MKHLTLFQTILLLFSWVFLPTTGHSQPGNERMIQQIQKGREALVNYEYDKAEKAFLKALEYNSENAEAKRGLAYVYDLTHRYEEAQQMYNRILLRHPRHSRAAYFEGAKIHLINGDYQRAIALFFEFQKLQELPAKDFGLAGETELNLENEYLLKVDSLINVCRIANDLQQFQTIRTIDNLGPEINTASDEYFPYLTNDQGIIFYTRREDQFSDEDLYFSFSSNQSWQPGQSLGSTFNSNKNEGMPSIVRNGRKLYFTACNRQNVNGTCDIWQGIIEGNIIRQLAPVEGPINSQYWESQASISCDGEELYFASTREGGFGGTDIWKSTLESDGSWSEPINLGPTINTARDEEAPYITNDGQTLYFSSTGHKGLGEQDIFICRQDEKGSWGPSLNLGAPLNSSFRELGFFLSADGKEGYFASDRSGGFGGMDIYKFELPEELYSEPITYVELIVLDSFTRKPLPTTIFTKERGNLVTDDEGRYFLCLPAEENFSFTILEDGYKSYFKRIRVPEWNNATLFSITALISPETPLKAAEWAEISTPTPKEKVKHSVFFDFNAHDLTFESTQQLEFFLDKVLYEEAIEEVEIVGYSDQIGSDRYNLLLSERRAKTVAVFLQKRGIRVDRVYIEGGGEILESIPDAEKRRVEIIFTLQK